MVDQPDAAGLASPAGIDLCLDDTASTHHFCGTFNLIGGQSYETPGNRDAVTAEDFLGLIFVDIHGTLSIRSIGSKKYSRGGRLCNRPGGRGDYEAVRIALGGWQHGWKW